MEDEPHGFLTLHRKLFASDLWHRREPFDSRSAFIDLLRQASYRPRPWRIQGREVQLKAGELLLEAKDLARRWGWSKSKVYRFLRELRDRGTLSSRPAWTQETSSKRAPWIYSFPNYTTHQKPWLVKPVSPTPSIAPEIKDVPSVTDPEKTRPVTLEKNDPNERDTGTRHREHPRNTRQNSDPVTLDHDTGCNKSDTGNTPAVIDDSPTPRNATEYKSFREILYLSNRATNDYEAVEALAGLADSIAWGNGSNPHRGLNIKLLVQAIKAGTQPDTLAHIIRGTRILADSGQVPWIQPGEPFCLTAIFGEQRHIQDQALSSLAYSTSKAEP